VINADKPHLWKADVAVSVDLYNDWFLRFAPQTYRDTRLLTARQVEATMKHTGDFAMITPADLKARPNILPTLRMSTAPPIARDRLIGLANAGASLVKKMENEGILPPRFAVTDLDQHLGRICGVIDRLLDRDLFPWLAAGAPPTDQERHRAATIVADRLCGAVSDPIVRNAQEQRQLALIENYLAAKGYQKKALPVGQPITGMEAGTFTFRLNLVVYQLSDGRVQTDATGNPKRVNIPVDAVIQPKVLRPHRFPILIEAKSAGDFTNTNKRRKEEATKINQLKATYGPHVALVLFLCGYFDSGYLGYEAAEGLDWIWEHRIADMDQLGL
jgi:hypothetical protein